MGLKISVNLVHFLLILTFGELISAPLAVAEVSGNMAVIIQNNQDKNALSLILLAEQLEETERNSEDDIHRYSGLELADFTTLANCLLEIHTSGFSESLHSKKYFTSLPLFKIFQVFLI